MIVFPAIDIKNGRCVRLRQGEASDVTVYGEDPVETALSFEEAGAEFLHVVDLDGAFEGKGVNTPLIRSICEAVSIPVETGGGIRTMDDIEELIPASSASSSGAAPSRTPPLQQKLQRAGKTASPSP